jgi:signal transduction histidine kinase
LFSGGFQLAGMRRLSLRTLWIVFSVAVLVLVTIAAATDAIAQRYALSEHWLTRTQQVRTRLTKLGADLAAAEAARLAFVTSGDSRELPLYNDSVHQIPLDLANLLDLNGDNSDRQRQFAQLRPLIEQRLRLLEESIDRARKNGSGNPAEQEKLNVSGAALSEKIGAMLDAAQHQEELLYNQRQTISQETYEWERAVLAVAFLVTMAIVALIFWTLLMQLQERKQAEEMVRKLSGRLLRIQDEERRHIARELHDSLGQLLSGLKMNLDHASSIAPSPGVLRESLETAIELAQDSIDETRTLSYLLHPPLLDEFGFASAAKWYIDGFVKRSKIAVEFDIPKDFYRLPEEIELALFRVLQESLTNIHRHSGSPTVEITARRTARLVTLRVTDHGRGISAETLEKFRKTRGSGGVGLAGMRERIDELGGILNLRSNERGTTLEVTAPLPEQRQGGESGSASSGAGSSTHSAGCLPTEKSPSI